MGMVAGEVSVLDKKEESIDDRQVNLQENLKGLFNLRIFKTCFKADGEDVLKI